VFILQQTKYTTHESNQKVFYKVYKIIRVVINLGFVRVTAMDRRVFGRVEKSRARLRTADGVAPATNCGIHEPRRRTTTNDNVEQCTGELEGWGELG
jgi:hypothetical protein